MGGQAACHPEGKGKGHSNHIRRPQQPTTTTTNNNNNTKPVYTAETDVPMTSHSKLVSAYNQGI